MKVTGKSWFAVLFLIIWAVIGLRVVPSTLAASSPSLGSANSYSIIAGTTVTNSGTTSISGNVGISPGASPPNDYIENGSSTIGGTVHDGDATAGTAQTDSGTAYAALAAQSCDTDYGAVTTDLAGKNLTPGVYCSDAFTLTGTLTLNGGPTDVWVFKSGGNLTTTGASANVAYTGGGNACNTWWYVPGAASLDVSSSFAGTIIADTNAALGSGATLDGRVFVTSADVTLDGNTVSGPTCVAPTSTPTPTPGPSNSDPGSSSDVLGDSTCFAPQITITPKIIEVKRISPTSMSLSWGPYEGMDTFVVEYGPQNGNWPYNVNVTGFTTVINDLPSNQPMWFRVAARNDCDIGAFSDPMEGGGSPQLPNAGLGPQQHNTPWLIILSVGLVGASSLFVITQLKRFFSLKG